MFVSVVTTAYNRAYRLPLLYESLCKQTDKDFEWIVVDDGSSDDTETLVQSYIDEAKLTIRYFYKENGGMGSAMNVGINNAEGLFVFKADSDDMLLENAIERVRYYYNSDYWKENKERPLSGICFLNQDANGEIIGDKFPEAIFISDYISVRINGKVRGDKSEVILTKYRKEALYLEFPNEKRYPTSGTLITLAKKYDMLFVNESIYIRDFLSDGITKYRRRGGRIITPEGTIHHTNLFLTKEFLLPIRLQKAREYVVCCIKAKKRFFNFVFKSNAPLLVLYVFPRSLLGWLYGRAKEKKSKEE